MTAVLATPSPLLPGAARMGHAERREHPLIAALSLFIGLSAANAMGGVLQFAFFGFCLGSLLRGKHRTPFGLMGGVVLCGVIATVTSLRGEPSITPLLSLWRPFVEGYLLAIFLYKFCQIRTLKALLTALAGYVAIELICATTMVVMPDLRMALINLWYPEDSYGDRAFRVALLFRGFGVSRHHLFGMPLALGIIGSLLIVGASLERSSFRRAILSSLAFASVLLILSNARIGLVPIFACYTLGISLYFRPYYFRHLVVLFAVLLPLLIALVQMYLGDVGEALIGWMEEGAMQFIAPSQAADTTTIKDLASMIMLPIDPLAWLIGNGRLCESGEVCYSDIGWIRLLQIGGLLLAIPVTVLYLVLIVKIYKGLNSLGMNAPYHSARSSRKLLLWVLVITFVLATAKGESFATNDYSRLMMTLAVFMHQLPRWSNLATTTKHGWEDSEYLPAR